jgi:riboflavin synthase
MLPIERGKRVEILAARVCDGLKPDDSVSVDGICLTVTRVRNDGFDAEAVEETLLKTTLGSWTPARPVNLERSVRADGRFGGHFVSGHVDGTGRVLSVETVGEGRRVEIEIPLPIAGYLIPKGSIAVNGISLTIAECTGSRFSVAVIPHTLRRTTLGLLRPGDRINIEADLLGKYVVQTLERLNEPRRDLRMERLSELGY